MNYDVLVNITDLCNSRCLMCNMWQNEDQGKSFLPAEILSSVRPLASVSIAGGEPFLHRRIVDVAETLHRENPGCKMIFSTNGFATRRIVADVERILAFHPKTQVTISLDGMEETHDRMRGIPGAWKKANETFDRLGEIGLRQRNFAFTITAENYRELPEVAAHARRRGAGLSLAVAQSSQCLRVEIAPLDHDTVFPFVNPLIESHLRSWNPANWARAFFVYGMLRHLATRKRAIPCDALDGHFMIDQAGNVLSCHPLLLPVGNLSRNQLPELLLNGSAEALRPTVRTCHACWEVCTARSGIRARWLRVGLWAAGNKLLSHLRLRNGRRPSLLFPATKESAGINEKG